MRDVIAWSYGLLSAEAREVFRRLAAFAGRSTLGAVTEVCSGSDTGPDLLDALSTLVEANLVQVASTSPTGPPAAVPEGGGTVDGPGLAQADAEQEVAFRLLETVRAFALEQLDSSGEAVAVHRRHATYYLSVARQSAEGLAGPSQGAWLARLVAEHDNLDAALRWVLDAGEASLGLQLAAALWPFWQRHSYLSEGRQWLGKFLRLPGAEGVAPDVRAEALTGAAWLAHDQDDFAAADALWQEGLVLLRRGGQWARVAVVLAQRAVMARCLGRYDDARDLAQEGEALARRSGDKAAVAYTVFRLGVVARERGELETSRCAYEEALGLYRSLGDSSGMAFALLGLGDVARDQGDAQAVEALCSEALAESRRLGRAWGTGFALNNLGLAAAMAGDFERAEALQDEAMSVLRTSGIRGGVVELLVMSGQVANDKGDHNRAAVLLEEGVELGWPAGPHWLVANGLQELARVAVAKGTHHRAAVLAGASRSWREAMSAPLPPYRHAAADAVMAAVGEALGQEDFMVAYKDGMALSPEAAVAMALRPVEPPPPRSRRRP
jgi:tetratricopeptide (TPR) repeat protein